MAQQIQIYLREQMPAWKDRYTGVEEMKVAVMGCIVNGPGESKHANLASRCREHSKSRKRRSTWTARSSLRSKATTLWQSSSKILDEYVESHYAAREALVAD